MWSGPAGIVVLVIILVGGLAGLAYLVMRTSSPMLPHRRAEERDTRDVQRDIPPGPN
jgi:hypothetical protein